MKRNISKYTFLLVVIVFMSFLTSCNTTENSEKKVIETFLNNVYTVEDYTKYTENILTDRSFTDNYLKGKQYKDIMTPEVFDSFAQHKNFIFYLLSSNLAKFNASVQEVKIEKYVDNKDKSIVYNYSGKILTDYVESNEKKIENVSGQVTLSKSSDNKWLISQINMMKQFTDEERFLKLRS